MMDSNEELHTDLSENELTDALSADTEVQFVAHVAEKVREELQKILVGQDELVEFLLAGLFVGGHVLLEGVPGVAKTLAVNLLSRVLKTEFNRVQFTPDLMPSDVVGTNVFNMKTSEFSFHKGPLFANVVLADEINRAPAKTQAAMFEVMEEKQITVDGKTHQLSSPFFIVATQNPIEQEGTYKLPEAQLDRFVFRLKLSYPSLSEEEQILHRFKSDFSAKAKEDIEALFSPEDIAKCVTMVEQVHIKDELVSYIANIVHYTRNNGDLFLGASPRASLAILKASKAIAAIRGRNFVTPDDVRVVAHPVLNHRIVLSPEKEIEGVETEDVVNEIISKIEVPR